MWQCWSERLGNQPTEYVNHLLIRLGCGLVYRSSQTKDRHRSLHPAIQWSWLFNREANNEAFWTMASETHFAQNMEKPICAPRACVNLKPCVWHPWLGAPWLPRLENHRFPSSRPQEPNPPAQVRNVCRLYLHRSKSVGWQNEVNKIMLKMLKYNGQ